MADESSVVVYGVPFVGVLLLAVGIPGAVLGGYSAVQEDLGLCGDPSIAVDTPAETERLTSGPASPTLRTLDRSALAPAEREAFERARASPTRTAEVRGEFPHRTAFERGVLVVADGTRYYATLVADGSCLAISPLLMPLGLVAVALGVAGLLTPPAYRKLAALEERTRYE